MRRLRYLKMALALVLAFVGGKMLIADRYRISDTGLAGWWSAGLIAFAAMLVAGSFRPKLPSKMNQPRD